MFEILKNNREKMIQIFQLSLKQIRLFLKITGQELGEIIGVTRQTINNLENMKTALSYTQYIAICAYLDNRVKNNPDLLSSIASFIKANQQNTVEDYHPSTDKVINIYNGSFLDRWFLMFPETNELIEKRIKEPERIETSDMLQFLINHFKVIITGDVFKNHGTKTFLENISPYIKDNKMIIPLLSIDKLQKKADDEVVSKKPSYKAILNYLKELEDKNIIEVRGEYSDLKKDIEEVIIQVLLKHHRFHRLFVVTNNELLVKSIMNLNKEYKEQAFPVLVGYLEDSGALKLYSDDIGLSLNEVRTETSLTKEDENFTVDDIDGWDSV